MAKKAKKTAVKKTSSKSKTTSRGKTASKVKAKSARVASANKAPTTVHSTVTRTGLRVTEYKLFTEDSVRSLEDQVNYHIKKGWSPVGGVVLQGTSTFTQTMVRHED